MNDAATIEAKIRDHLLHAVSIVSVGPQVTRVTLASNVQEFNDQDIEQLKEVLGARRIEVERKSTHWILGFDGAQPTGEIELRIEVVREQV